MILTNFRSKAICANDRVDFYGKVKLKIALNQEKHEKSQKRHVCDD